MRVSLISSLNCLPAHELNSLATPVPQASVFSEPDFLTACAAAISPATSSLTLAVHMAGALAATISLGRSVGSPVFRTGRITSAAPRLVDQTTVRLHPDVIQERQAVLAAIGRSIAEIRRQGNEVDIRYMADDDPLLGTLPGCRIAARKVWRRTALAHEWQQVIRDGHQRREIQRCQRRLDEAGATLHWLQGSDDALEFLRRFSLLHTRLQQELQHRTSLFADPRIAVALAPLMQQWITAGKADLGLLQSGEHILAAYILFHRERTTWAWRTAYDRSQRSFGAGSVMLAAAIDRAAARGSTAYEFGYGDEPYKRHWSDAVSTVCRIAAPALGTAGLMDRAWRRLTGGLSSGGR